MYKFLTFILLVTLFLNGSDSRNIGEELLTGFEAALNSDVAVNSGESCQCTDISCECCSTMGPSQVCNAIKLVSIDEGFEDDFALELSVDIDEKNIFSETVSLKELEPICYPYGDFNYCVQVDLRKNQQGKGKVCGNFLAKQRGKLEEARTVLKTEIFCLQLEANQLTKHVMDLLRFVSQSEETEDASVTA